jgi:hypothetical protein
MALWHPVTRAIFDSLVRTPKGMDVDPKRAPTVLKTLAEGDAKAKDAFFETIGLLQATFGKPAADTLRMLVLEAAGKRPAHAWAR